MEKLTTPHPVKQQTLEVSGLLDGCQGQIEVNGWGVRACWVNLNAAEVSMTQRLVCGYHTDWASTFLSCLCRDRESCSIQPHSNSSISAPFLCPRPKLTSDLSRLSARASWLSSNHVLYVISNTLHLWFQLGGLSQDISLLSRAMWKERDLSDWKKQGKICITCAHTHVLGNYILIRKTTK